MRKHFHHDNLIHQALDNFMNQYFWSKFCQDFLNNPIISVISILAHKINFRGNFIFFKYIQNCIRVNFSHMLGTISIVLNQMIYCSFCNLYLNALFFDICSILLILWFDGLIELTSISALSSVVSCSFFLNILSTSFAFLKRSSNPESL
jgi:hypothetical protein